MFRKLRVKFIALAMAVLILAVVAVLGAVLGLMYGQIMEQVFSLAEVITENGGSMPVETTGSTLIEKFQDYTPELRYETRYFSVLVEADGTVSKVNDDSIRSFRRIDINGLAEEVFETESKRGLIEHAPSMLAYQQSNYDEDTTLIVFIDCSSRYWIIDTVFRYMYIVGGLVLVIFFVLMLFFSRRLIEPYIENDQRQKSFITNASHELKTPLAVISANTEMIEALNGSDKWTDSIKRQVERLNGLIASLVTLSRSNESEKMSLVRVDFSSVVREIEESFEPVIISQGKSHNHDITPDIHINADQKALDEVVTILIDNATKYCDDGGEVMTLLHTDKKRRKAVLKVSNTYADGAGVDYSRFFDRFYREDASHNNKKSGYGIGLSIAKAMVERMRGKIRIDYANGVITFTVTFDEVTVTKEG